MEPVRRLRYRLLLTRSTPRFRMGNAIRFTVSNAHFRCEWEILDYPDTGKVELEPIYKALDIGGDPFCIIMLGWLNDPNLVMLGGDNELLKQHQYLTWQRPTDGHNIAGPVLILNQYGTPGEENEYWGPLTSKQEEIVKWVMTNVYGWNQK